MQYLISLETLDGCTFPIPNVIQFCLTYVNVQCLQRLIKELCDDHFPYRNTRNLFLFNKTIHAQNSMKTLKKSLYDN